MACIPKCHRLSGVVGGSVGAGCWQFRQNISASDTLEAAEGGSSQQGPYTVASLTLLFCTSGHHCTMGVPSLVGAITDARLCCGGKSPYGNVS